MVINHIRYLLYVKCIIDLVWDVLIKHTEVSLAENQYTSF